MAAPEGYNALGKIGISYKGEYASNTAYERLDAVAHNGSTYLAIKDAPDGAPRDDKLNWIYLAKGFSGDIGDSEIAFTEAENRENINTGESVKTVFGKIKKFFTDLTAPAFAQMITSKDDLLATKAAGYVPDAKAVADAYTELNGKLNQNTDLTLVNCVSWESDNTISKIGNRVFVTLGVQITSEQSSGSLIIASIARTYYPKTTYVRANAAGGTNGDNHMLYINKSNGVVILNLSTERYYSASFSYLAN
jgi:hypothetical protein